MKLIIAVVSNRDHCADFTKCLASLVAYLAEFPIFEEVDLKIAKNCSSLSNSRQSMLDECIRSGASHILWLDDDMVFPADLCHCLFSHNKRLIGCNSLVKNPDYLHYTAKGVDGGVLASKGKTGIEEVESVGLALFLMETDVIRKNPKPHFEVVWNAEKQSYTGEDVYFCRKLRKSGEKIFIDHAASNLCGHVGSLVYTFSFYDRFRDGGHKNAG